jgi:hypothetical protein
VGVGIGWISRFAERRDQQGDGDPAADQPQPERKEARAGAQAIRQRQQQRLPHRKHAKDQHGAGRNQPTLAHARWPSQFYFALLPGTIAANRHRVKDRRKDEQA